MITSFLHLLIYYFFLYLQAVLPVIISQMEINQEGCSSNQKICRSLKYPLNFTILNSFVKNKKPLSEGLYQRCGIVFSIKESFEKEMSYSIYDILPNVIRHLTPVTKALGNQEQINPVSIFYEILMV